MILLMILLHNGTSNMDTLGPTKCQGVLISQVSLICTKGLTLAPQLSVCVFVCVCVCVCVCTSAHVCMCVCMRACTSVHVYVIMHTP